MDIGGALAEARSEAGLTITQVSERTRIRETIIRDIERDDYSACGGDFYARGHIRAIAKVVGTDPVPLIEEYDTASVPASDAVAPGLSAPARVDPDADTDPGLLDGDRLEFDLPGRLWPGLRRSARRWISTVSSRLAGPAERTVAGALRPRSALPGISTSCRAGLPQPRRSGLACRWTSSVVGRGGPACSGSLHWRSSASWCTCLSPVARTALRRHRGRTTVPARQRSTRARRRPAVPPDLALPARSRWRAAAAFGPAGLSQGDDRQAAALAVDGSAGTAWHTDWYTTASLGGLQSGTGLLLSLGKTATIASATIVLGATPGGAIELRAGDTPALADLPVVAQAANPGGTLTMRPGVPVRARYLLIWFTSLPPDNAGTYEASIYDVRLSGTG